MKRKKWKSAKARGNELESLVKQMLEEALVPYVQERTMQDFGGRAKGKVDFVIKNPLGYLECKRYTNAVTFCLNSEKHDISWSPIAFLNRKMLEGCISGFLLQETIDQDVYYISTKDFMNFYMDTTKKSMNLKDIKEHGTIVSDMKWLISKEEIV